MFHVYNLLYERDPPFVHGPDLIVADLLHHAGQEVIHTCQVCQQKNIPQITSSSWSHINFGNTIQLSQDWLRRLSDSADEVQEVPDNCCAHMLLTRHRLYQIPVGGIRQVSHDLHRTVVSSIELLSTLDEQIPNLTAREVAVVYLVQNKPALAMT